MNGFEIAGFILGGIPIALMLLVILAACGYSSFVWIRDFKLDQKITSFKQGWKNFWSDGFQIGQGVFILLMVVGLACMLIGDKIKKDIPPGGFDIIHRNGGSYYAKGTSEGLVIYTSKGKTTVHPTNPDLWVLSTDPQGVMVINWDDIRKQVEYANHQRW